MSIETVQIIETWLFSTLSGDATLSGLVGGRFVGTLSPDYPDVPFVTWTMASTRDIRSQDGTIIDTTNLYNVKAVGLGSTWDVVTPIASRIHDLIDKAVVSFGGNSSLTCSRDAILQYPEVVTGQEYRHLGGIYRIRAN